MYKQLGKFKIVCFIILAPVLMATQCEDDFENSGFETNFVIQNDAERDLFLLKQGTVFEKITASSTLNIGSELNSETISIAPSESFQFNEVKLFVLEDGNYNLVYEQNPINDELWILSEPSVNRFEYKLIVTAASLN